MDHKPTVVPPETHLTQEQLNEYYYQHLERSGHKLMAIRYRANKVLMPKSRHDLVRYYTKLDLESKEA